MKKKVSAIVSLPKLRLSVGQNRYFIILFLMSFAGLIFGTVAAIYELRSGETAYIQSVLDRFDLSQTSFQACFLSLAVSNVCAVLLLFFLGLCIAGNPFIAFTLFLKAGGISAIGTWYCYYYTANGLKVCLLLFYPAQMILLAAMILGGVESLYTVSELRGRTVSSTKSGKLKLGLYIKRYIVPFFLSLLSAAIQSVCLCGSKG